MKTLKIVMKPLDAYFLGGERNAAHENSPTQRTQRNPYLIHSNRMLSQSAAFGALRYLGIRSPKPSFRLEPEDRANIGAESYQITSEGQKFGKIHCISPVLLVDRQGQRGQRRLCTGHHAGAAAPCAGQAPRLWPAQGLSGGGYS